MTEQEKLLVLNIIAYSNNLTKINYENRYLKDYIDELKAPSTVPQDDWDKIVKTVKEDKSFADIKIKKIESVKNKQLNILFTNSKNQAIVVFKGTDKYEWHDNAAGGQWDTSDTAQQKNANKFITDNCKGYNEVIVSGHSKGGNKAQYVAILNDLVTRAYSFDGQGMGYNFIYKYADQIKANKGKISMYNYASDFVNPLFINMGIGDVNYVYSDKSILDYLMEGDFENFALLHSPDKMFDFSGNEIQLKKTKDVKQDPVALLINGLTEYMMLHLNEEDWKFFSNMMVHMFENGDCSGEFNMSDMPKDFLPHVLNEGIAYLTEKMGFSLGDACTFLALILIKGMGDQVLKDFPELKGYINDLSISSMKIKISKLIIETTGNDIVRNYTQEMQEDFKQLVSEAQDDEPIYHFWEWDVWSKIGDSFNGGYTLEDADNDLDKYRKHMIDMEDITKKGAEQIFTDVYKTDQEFANSIKGIYENISRSTKDIKENLLDKINL